MATRTWTWLKTLPHEVPGQMTVQAVLWLDAPAKPVPLTTRTRANASLVQGTAHALTIDEQDAILLGTVIEKEARLGPLPDDMAAEDVHALLDLIYARATAALAAEVKEGAQFGSYRDDKGTLVP